MLWFVEVVPSARVLVASYSFDDVVEHDLPAFLTAVLTGSESSEVSEKMRSLVVAHGDVRWVSE